MKNYKNSVWACALAVLALMCSCNKENSNREDAFASSETKTITVSVKTGPETKVLGETGEAEAAVSDLQILVFNAANGRIEAYKSVSASSANVSFSKGSRIICACVNAPSYAEVYNYSELLKKQVSYENQTTGKFVMYGKATIDENYSQNTLSIQVTRLISRVVLKNIKREFDAPNLQGLEFTVTDVYVTNVRKAANIGILEGNISSELADSYAVFSDYPAFLANTLLTDKIGQGGSLEKKFTFYPMPAHTSTDSKMRLVIKAKLGNEVMYYPIELPHAGANVSYTVDSVTIKLPGTTSDDQIIERAALDFSITVKPWDETPGQHEFSI